RRQVEEADLGGRSADRSERTKVDGPLDRGGGGHRRLQAPYAVAARRLPLRASADNPPPDPLVVAPLSAAAWDRAVAGYRERHRAPLHQDQPSLDQRSGRTDEPNHQGRDRQTRPLRQP